MEITLALKDWEKQGVQAYWKEKARLFVRKFPRYYTIHLEIELNDEESEIMEKALDEGYYPIFSMHRRTYIS